MTREKMLPILQKIQEYDHIILFRHKRPGRRLSWAPAKGCRGCCSLSFPEKQVLICRKCDGSEHLAFLGPDDRGYVRGCLSSMRWAWWWTPAPLIEFPTPIFPCAGSWSRSTIIPNVEPYAPTLWVEEDCSSCV